MGWHAGFKVFSVSGVVHSTSGFDAAASQPLRFGEFLARINRAEQIERAAGRRSVVATEGEGCRHGCSAPAASQADRPTLGEVRPIPAAYDLPIRATPQITIQQLLPIGSIIDVTI